MDIYKFIENNISEKSLFFEIGSHFGIDTEKFTNFTKNLHCFEPDPRNIEMFKKLGLNVILNNVAVSNIDGYAEFYLSSGDVYESIYGPTNNDILNKNDWSASSSLKFPKNHKIVTPWVKFEKKITVQTTRIDTYCVEKSIEKIDFIWMDVQGAEIEVIEGIGNMKNKIHFIYTEYSDSELYENQPTKNKIIENLGIDWKVIFDFGGDILLENMKYKSI
jgi:FkbM family methyltransferase